MLECVIVYLSKDFGAFERRSFRLAWHGREF
jgi:hypothetical protein